VLPDMSWLDVGRKGQIRISRIGLPKHGSRYAPILTSTAR